MELILSEAEAQGTRIVLFSGEEETLASAPAQGEPDKIWSHDNNQARCKAQI